MSNGSTRAAEKVVMPDGHVDVPSGGSAELQTQPTNTEYTAAYKLIVGISEASAADKLDRIPDFVSVFLTSWDVKDRDGKPLGTDRESIASARQSDLMTIYARTVDIFKAIEIPKA